MAFPAGPYTDGQTHTEAGVPYTYSTSVGAWLKNEAGGTGGVDSTRLVTGVSSVTGGGDLSADRTFQLVGDAAAPGANRYYGTWSSTARGFQTTNNFYFNNLGSYPPPGRRINTTGSMTGGGDIATSDPITLVGDVASPGPNMDYASGVGNAKGWYPRDMTVDPNGIPTSRTIGSSASIRMLNVAGATENLTKSLFPQLSGDVAAPGSRKYYGTSTAGTKGWFNTRLPAWQDMFFGTPGLTIAANTTAMNRFANGGGTGEYAFNATATQLITGRAQRVTLTVKTAEAGRVIYAWVGSLSAILMGGPTDSNGFWTGNVIVNPTATWPISIRNGGSSVATIEYLRLHFSTLD